jgi:hypothetical protein
MSSLSAHWRKSESALGGILAVVVVYGCCAGVLILEVINQLKGFKVKREGGEGRWVERERKEDTH